MADVMTLHNERVRELMDQLRHELSVPDNAMWFEVRFAVNECVTVKCEYMPSNTGGSDG